MDSSQRRILCLRDEELGTKAPPYAGDTRVLHRGEAKTGKTLLAPAILRRARDEEAVSGQKGHFPKLPVLGRDTGLGPDQGQSHGLKGKLSQQMTPERKKGRQVTQTPTCTLTMGGLGQKTPRRGVFDESQAFLGLGSATQGPASTTDRKLLGNPKAAETERFWIQKRPTRPT